MSQRKKPECYIANPFGFAESTRYFYNENMLPVLSKYVTVLDPWKVNVDHIFRATKDQRPALWLELGDHHFNTIRTQAKLMIACLDQEPPDNGTVAEVVCAAENGVPVIGYRNDLRTAGEEGLPYNLMIGAAIRASGGLSVTSLVELEQQLKEPSTEALESVLGR